MIINRHNYEEFFLLYVDKELDLNGRTAVESFISQNPDLAKELQMLQQAMLADDRIQFKQKELLFKKEQGISLANYEEYFLLHADNELNEQEVAETHHFVLQHPQLQNEFTLLQLVRLKPELIEFSGKENLYRKEKKVRRIIPFAMVRVGAAAAVAGIIYISFIVLNNNNSNSNVVIATTEKPVTKTEKIDSQIQKSLTEKLVAASNIKKENKKDVRKARMTSGKLVKHNPETIIEIKRRSEKAFLANKSKTNLKKETLHTDIDIAFSEKIIEKQTYSSPEQTGIKLSNNNHNSKIFNDPHKDGSNNVTAKQTITEKQPALIANAVYLEIDNNEEEKGIYVGSVEINKNKLKGLFKKATGFLNKKIHENDN